MSKNTTVFSTPVITPLESFPPNSNPYQHDLERMVCTVSGAWVAMFSAFGGIKQSHNMSEEEKERSKKGEAIFYDDPDHIIMVNQKTGQRFMIDFTQKIPKVGDRILCVRTAGTGSKPIIRGKMYEIAAVDTDGSLGKTSIRVKGHEHLTGAWFHSSCFKLN